MRAGVALVLGTGFLVLFVGGGARFGIGLAFKPMVDELGWGRGQLGLAIGLYMVVSAVATFMGGRLADRAGPRLLLGLGTLVGGIGIGLMSLVTEPWHAMLFYGVVFAIGNGAASMAPVGVMVTRAAPGRAGLANAVAMSGISAGQLVMMAALTVALLAAGWRSIFVWLALAHAGLLALFLLPLPGHARQGAGAAAPDGLSLREAARTPQFWALLAIYAICGLDDFFVATHVVPFALDTGVGVLFAGNLLALMGLAALVGVLAAGAFSDRTGPVLATALVFAVRVAVFGLIAVDRSPVSVAIFALVFGATFLVTAPLTLLFVRDCFGTRNLGALTGLITMVHQIFGGIGAYGGGLVFDATGNYDAAFVLMLVASAGALLLCPLARRPATSASARSRP